MEHNKRSSFFRQTRICPVGSGASVGLGKYLEISVSGSKSTEAAFSC